MGAAGVQMLLRYPAVCEAVFIHVVQPVEMAFGIEALQALDAELRGRVVLFSDYIEAATSAACRGLLDIADLLPLVLRSRTEFQSAIFKNSSAREAARVQWNASA